MVDGKTIRERLAVVETKLDTLITHFENHLSDHRKLFWVVITATLAGLGNFVYQVLCHLTKGQ